MWGKLLNERGGGGKSGGEKREGSKAGGRAREIAEDGGRGEQKLDYDACGDIGATFMELEWKKMNLFRGSGAENSKRIAAKQSTAHRACPMALGRQAACLDRR